MLRAQRAMYIDKSSGAKANTNEQIINRNILILLWYYPTLTTDAMRLPVLSLL